ncbi:MAG: conjugal transfer protein TraC [Burkholderiales bacterium]|nr:conjugal transfer protein TraC [Burkholderiales bacterium]
MLKNIIRKVLNKYNVDNVAELKGVFFNKMRNDDIPDPDVIDINNKTEFNPCQLEFQDILEKNRIADFLGIEWFDEETNIYQTERAHGFIFNCGTLVGCSSDLDDQLKGLFNLGIPDYTGMQILLIASSELEDKFNSYESIHHSPLLQKVAQERIKFYRQGLKESLRPGYKLPVRDFKLVITFTFDGLYDENNYAAMTSLQQSISSVLKSCYVANQMMKPDGLINLLREILCTSMNPVEKHNYNPNLPIKEQITEIDNNIWG